LGFHTLLSEQSTQKPPGRLAVAAGLHDFVEQVAIGLCAPISIFGYCRAFASFPSSRITFKFHAAERHRIPKARYRVQNWPDYDRGLVRRGDIRAWLSDDAIVGWRATCRTTPGGQRRFSNLAIETTLMLGAVMHLLQRQTGSFVR
jgi:Transposase DDE domain